VLPVRWRRLIDIRNILRRDTTLAIFCAPQVRFWHKADNPRCLAIFIAQPLSQDHFVERTSMLWAAS